MGKSGVAADLSRQRAAAAVTPGQLRWSAAAPGILTGLHARTRMKTRAAFKGWGELKNRAGGEGGEGGVAADLSRQRAAAAVTPGQLRWPSLARLPAAIYM